MLALALVVGAASALQSARLDCRAAPKSRIVAQRQTPSLAARRLQGLRLAAAVGAAPEGPYAGPLSVKVGGKALNLNGVAFVASMTVWVTALYPLVLVCATFSLLFDKSKRRAMDAVVALWAKVSMLTVGYAPQIRNPENLPPRGKAVMYIPNHCSYLDILTLSGFLGRPFKYISKIEILRIPLIGWAMGFAGHVAIKRADRRSQNDERTVAAIARRRRLETYKQAVQSLKDGNSLVVFAEGTRSLDGTLKDFKRGPFKMAMDAGVDIVPIALCDLYRWHPPSALMPLKRPRGVEIAIMPAVKMAPGKTADDLMKEVRAAIDGALPSHQKNVTPPAAAAVPAAAA